MLEMSAVNTYYGETQVLFDVSIDVRGGEAVALLGPNGAGKTTTVRLLNGVLTPDGGHSQKREETHFSPAKPFLALDTNQLKPRETVWYVPTADTLSAI